MGTPHINANKGDFAKVVLMPGDPLRAQWIIDTFLEDPKAITTVRGNVGYTAKTKSGKRISVMASGMGMPSIGIYSHELFNEYDVDLIIRVGTCGAYQEGIDLGDVLIAQAACTDSNWSSQYELHGGTYSAIADYDVLVAAVEASKKAQKGVHVGNILSSDIFYNHAPNTWKKWAELGVLGVEMESYALYCNAVLAKKKALGIFTASDSFLFKKILTPEERQTGLIDMVKIALEVAEKYAE